MSGLTPILDTLLSQVLGKRVDVQSQQPKSLDQPVSQVLGVASVRPVQSDTDLHPRSLRPGATGVEAATAAGRGEGSSSHKPGVEPQARTGAPAATQTKLSEPARLIARLLSESGPANGAIKVRENLISSAEDAKDVRLVADRLGQSVRTSGLFYESHLNKWFQGRMSTGQLAKEPQMQLAAAGAQLAAPGVSRPETRAAAAHLPSVPERADSAKSAGNAGDLAKPVATDAGLQKGGEHATAERLDARSRLDSSSLASASTRFGVETTSPNGSPGALSAVEAQEQLHALVRHQLTLLGLPHLRWEGEFAQGMFVYLELNVPNQQDDSSPAKEREERPADAESGCWESKMTVGLPALGGVSLRLRKWRRELQVEVLAEQQETLSILQASVAGIEERLGALGIERTAINVALITPQSPPSQPEQDDA